MDWAISDAPSTGGNADDDGEYDEDSDDEGAQAAKMGSQTSFTGGAGHVVDVEAEVVPSKGGQKLQQVQSGDASSASDDGERDAAGGKGSRRPWGAGWAVKQRRMGSRDLHS